MEITGKIILALPEMTGVSKNGEWKKREYVLETQEQYPKKVFFTLFGSRADQYPLQPGQMVKLSYDIESREYNGRWYTNINGWKVEDASQGSAPVPPQNTFSQPQAPSAPATPVDPFAAAPGDSSEDLPF